jgi:hypothetical protein
MLNLSDNELDRLSREAASQHDPGDLLGPQSWERLELRLDKELGRAGPDISRGFRGFRRLPFYYAPALLLVVGVTYYFVKAKGRKTESSGSPPLTVVKTPQEQAGTDSISSLKNPAYSDKSTTTVYADVDSSSAASTGAPMAPASGQTPASGETPASGQTNDAHDSHLSPPTSNSDIKASASGSPVAGKSAGSGLSKTSGRANGSGFNDNSGTAGSAGAAKNSGSGKGSGIGAGSGLVAGAGLAASFSHSGRNGQANSTTNYSEYNKSSGKGNKPSGRSGRPAAGSQATDLLAAGIQTSGAAASSEPERAFVQHPFSLRSHPKISDSALRAYSAKIANSSQKNAGQAVHVNRALGIGVQFAPDFASVNSLAGDRPGSSLGLTLDYEVLNNLHLGTGLLYSRRNYTARGMDYHVPDGYYWQNGMKPADFVKGTMNMLEIPITIRYDFSEAGNTKFFASAGVSSYLFGQEHCNYYFDFFGNEACRDFHYTNTPNALFSSINLSLGVEAKLSNDFSVLVAPYMKLPSSDIGFGKVKMSSVGINFAVRFTPVIGRSRKY